MREAGLEIILQAIRLVSNSLLIYFTFALISISAVSSNEEIIYLIATSNDRVIFEINDERYILSKSNPKKNNVTLIESNNEEVILRINQRRVILNTDDNAALIVTDDDPEVGDSNSPVILWATSNGFFFADGKVNGASVKFLVDTGADIVTFSSAQADKLGIDYENGKSGFASTASGITALKSLKVPKMSIGHISLYDVQISVVDGNFPEVPLLGGSFLNKLDMSRIGNKMELTKR